MKQVALPIMFTVPGRPAAFIAQWGKTSWSRRKIYIEYCRMVRLFARGGGWREDLKATREEPLLVHTRAYFDSNRHPDPENVHKVIVDALMYNATGERRSSTRDKFTGGGIVPPRYDEKNPRVEVVIADGRLPLAGTIPEGW